MSGMRLYYQYKELEDTCERLGFRIGSDRFDTYTNTDMIVLYPGHGDELPAYSRDARLFSGNLDECQSFLAGWQRSLEYLQAIRVITKTNVQKAEKKHVEMLEAHRLIRAIREGRDPGDLRHHQEDDVPF